LIEVVSDKQKLVQVDMTKFSHAGCISTKPAGDILKLVKQGELPAECEVLES
jgi:hypothetical protein